MAIKMDMNANLVAELGAAKQRIAMRQAHKDLLHEKVKQDLQKPAVLLSAAAAGFVIGLVAPNVDMKRHAGTIISLGKLF